MPELLFAFKIGSAGSTCKGLRRPIAAFLLALSMISGACATALAQAGPEPGLTDPVGAPASYVTLRSDDLMIGQRTSKLRSVLRPTLTSCSLFCARIAPMR